MNDNPDPEELLQRSKTESRLNSDPQSPQSTDEETPTLVTAIVETFEELDRGDRSPNLTIRDENLAALVGGLEATDEMAALSSRASDHLGRDDLNGDPEARATALRLLLRVALEEVNPDLLEALRDGRREYLSSKADEI